jgi:hypothetical protein
MTSAPVVLTAATDLRTAATAQCFDGHRHGDGIDVSFFLNHTPPGRGAGAHRHPYAEVFAVQDGRGDAHRRWRRVRGPRRPGRRRARGGDARFHQHRHLHAGDGEYPPRQRDGYRVGRVLMRATTVQRRSGGGEAASVRVSDSERAQAVDRLAGHAAVGRLTIDELEQRVELAQQAVLVADLAVLERDLPALDASASSASRHRPAREPLLAFAAVVLSVSLVLAMLVGHPVVPPVLLAALFWHAARRNHRPLIRRSFT